MSLTTLLHNAKPAVKENIVRLEGKWPNFTLFLSVSGGKTRAEVVHSSGENFEDAWKQLVEQASERVSEKNIIPQYLRIDWVRSVRETHLGQLKDWLKDIKRNYFRYGLAFDTDFKTAFLEQELNSNAMLYGGHACVHAVVNQKNFERYAKKRFLDFHFEFENNAPIYMLDTQGVFCSTEESSQLLHPKGRDAGRRAIERMTKKDALGLIERSSHYLATQVKDTGQFYYGWHPCFDRYINTYNTLRHTSTTYSMIEAWELTQDPKLEKAILRSIHYIVNTLIRRVTLKETGKRIAFLAEHTGKEVKLGANAVCILALSKYSEVTGTQEYLELLEQLALGIEYMQDKKTGKFVHVLNYPELTVKEEFRIIYYDGEAAFGLMRLYGLTKDERWLNIVEKAFDYFIAAEHWKAHDHWLSYCVNELTLYRDDERYYKFGLQNVVGYLDFIANRITTFPTLLELMMAAERMITRLQSSIEHQHLLQSVDLEEFYSALEKRAHYLLNGHFWPEYAMYFENPNKIVGSFFIRHHSFRVRIDDVEHYLSGFVAYKKYLESKVVTVAVKTNLEGFSVLSKEGLAKITHGQWIVQPEDDWVTRGICTHKSVFEPDHLLLARGRLSKDYLSDQIIKQLLSQQAAAIVCCDPTPYLNLGVPILQVRDIRAATLALGRAARNAFSGRVVGITGSAGKTTTVAMMAHALSPFGVTGQTKSSANLPIGIAWNQVNMPEDAASWVVEMAIGQMAVNAALVKPQLAIITNIAPAHLEFHENTQTIAERKSLIMNEMEPGGSLILFGEILHKDIFLAKAKEKDVSVITYGENPDNDIHLLEIKEKTIVVDFFNHIVEFDIGLYSKHMILNALSVFASLRALNLEWKEHLGVFKDFNALKGRGEKTVIEIGDKKITLYDEAYNANPISMNAAIASMAGIKEKGNRFLILGDMMELGADEILYHKNLINSISQAKPDKLILCGSRMQHLWQDIIDSESFTSVKKKWYPNIAEVLRNLDQWIDDRDHIVLKASNSIGFNQIVNKLSTSAKSVGSEIVHDHTP